MYDSDLTAVATGAAGTLVAAIATSGAERMRRRVAHFFRRATADRQRAAAQAVDDTAAQLAARSPDARALAVSAWARLIEQQLTDHRDAAAELDELAVPTSVTSKVWNQRNTGAGTFIGGDLYGGATFIHGGAPDAGQ